MRVLVAGNDDATTAKVSNVLNHALVDCTLAGVVPLEVAVSRVEMFQPDLVLLAMSPDSERALGVLKAIRQITNGHLAGIGEAGDGRLIIRALHEGGADEYLDVADLERELTATLERVKAKVGMQVEPGRVIVVLGPSGGSGSSTLAVNIATVMAQQHKECALLDLHVESGDLATLLDLNPTRTLADFCKNLNRIDRGLFEQLFMAHKSGVRLLASPRSFGEEVLVTPEGMRQAVLMARSVFPNVVVDIENRLQAEEAEILRMADTVVIVFRLDFASLKNVRRTIDRLERLGISRNRLQLVVNRYGQPREVSPATAESALKFKLSHYVPDDPKSVNRANNNGIPVVLESPWSTVTRRIKAIAMSLNGRVEAPSITSPLPRAASLAKTATT